MDGEILKDFLTAYVVHQSRTIQYIDRNNISSGFSFDKDEQPC